MHSTYTIPGRIERLSDQGALPIVELCSPQGRAQICLQGAQVIDYRPNNQPPLLWLSDKSPFEPGKPVRGGIPICWPWFGDHPQDADLPAHGFARTRQWQVLDGRVDGDNTCLTLGLHDDEASRQLWPYAFKLELRIQLGRQLTLTLTSHNPNPEPMPITEALHSYFAVSDIGQVGVAGLKGCRYRDKLDDLKAYMQDAALTIKGETDRVYLDTDATVTLDDPGFNRQILIHKAQSRTTVVWNPWQDKARAMSDVDDAGYKTMLCVETANALDNALEIAPGQSHSLSARIESVLYDNASLIRERSSE